MNLCARGFLKCSCDAWGANLSYIPWEHCFSPDPSLQDSLLAPQSKFQLLLHCWHLCPRAQEVSTMLLGQSTWTCALLGQTLTRASLYLSLIPAAGIAVMPFIVLVPCLFFPALQSAGLLPGRSWPAANPSCSMRWVFTVGTYSVQKQRSFKGKKHSHWTKVAKKILWWLERNGCFRLLSLLCWLYQKYIPDCLTILALALLSCSACCLVSLIFIKWLFLKFMVCLAGKALDNIWHDDFFPFGDHWVMTVGPVLLILKPALVCRHPVGSSALLLCYNLFLS